MDKNAEPQLCVLCCQRPATTKDHVPPRSLFTTPAESGLIAVPACRECNEGASQDDEYFRNVVTLRDDIHEHPDAQNASAAFIRSLKRPQAEKLKRAVLQNIQQVNLKTLSGLYVGKRSVCNVELDRLEKVASRIVRGLFFHEVTKPLPAEYSVFAWCEDGLTEQSDETKAEICRIAAIVKTSQETTIGNGVFAFWWKPTEVDNATAWVLQFYKRLSFLCVTLPSNVTVRGPFAMTP